MSKGRCNNEKCDCHVLTQDEADAKFNVALAAIKQCEVFIIGDTHDNFQDVLAFWQTKPDAPKDLAEQPMKDRVETAYQILSVVGEQLGIKAMLAAVTAHMVDRIPAHFQKPTTGKVYHA